MPEVVTLTVNEFKAWFEGYTEAIRGAPTKKQWERICERVSQIDPVAPATWYYYPYPYAIEPRRSWWPAWMTTSGSGSTMTTTMEFDTTTAIQTGSTVEGRPVIENVYLNAKGDWDIGNSPPVEAQVIREAPPLSDAAAWSVANMIGRNEAMIDAS